MRNLVVICTLLFLVAGSSSALVFIVVPSNVTNYSCSSQEECHSISYYTSNSSYYFVSSAIFVFQEGEHLLNSAYPVNISNVDNLTLQGSSQFVQGHNQYVLQSLSVIRCSKDIGGGLVFDSISNLSLINISFIGCGANLPSSLHVQLLEGAVAQTLLFLSSSFVHMFGLSVTNSTGFGLIALNSNYFSIESSSFAYNSIDFSSSSCADDSAKLCSREGGNFAFIASNNVIMSVTHSNFSYGYGQSLAGGLGIYVDKGLILNVHLTLSWVLAYHNTGNLLGANICLRIISLQSYIVINRTNSLYGRMLGDYPSDQCLFGAGLSIEVSNIIDISGGISLATVPSSNEIGGSKLCILDTVVDNNVGTGTFLKSFIKYSFSTFIHDCSFSGNLKNYGESGGGLVVDTSGQGEVYALQVSNSNISGNRAIRGAGFMFSGYTDHIDSWKYQLTISTCFICDNEGFFGTGLVLKAPRGDTFGSAVDITSVTVCKNKLYHRVSGDFIPSAILVMVRSMLQVSGLNVFENEMTGMAVVENQVTFNGNSNQFINNTNTFGGGLTLYGKSIVYLNGRVTFSGNNATVYGGAIYVANTGAEQTTVLMFSPPHETNQCTLQPVLGPDSSPMIVFSDNSAGQAGADIFGGLLTDCYVNNEAIGNSSVSDYLQCNFSSAYWQVNSITDSASLSSVSSTASVICPCDEVGQLDCYKTVISIQVYPSEPMTFAVATVGQCGGISPASLITNIAGEVTIISGELNPVTGKSCTNLMYQLRPLNPMATAALTLRTTTNNKINSSLDVYVDFLPCPVGFQLNQETMECTCAQPIVLLGANITCDVTTQLIQRTGMIWVAYISHNITDITHNQCVVAHNGCPYDFCLDSAVIFNVKQPELQCAYNRSGILCGQCQSGLSLVLGSNRCSACTYNTLTLLLPFLAAGIMLLAVLILCDLTVSNGSINGLLFYANIFKLNQAVFFPYGPVPVFSQFIAWLNLDFGIEICFYDGLDAYQKTWLQFVFPLYLFMLSSVMAIYSRRSRSLSQLHGGSTMPVLATLLLLSYSKILQTVTNALSISYISCNESMLVVWTGDANVLYNSMKHIVLVAFSSLVLLLVMLYTLILLLSPLVQTCCYKLSPLLEAYEDPYKKECKFWTGILLLARFALTTLFPYIPQTLSSIAITFVLTLILCLAWFLRGVYHKSHSNALEILFLINLTTLSLVSIAGEVMNNKLAQSTATLVSVGFTMACLFLIVLVQLWVKYRKNVCFKPQGVSSTAGNGRALLELNLDSEPDENHDVGRAIELKVKAKKPESMLHQPLLEPDTEPTL